MHPGNLESYARALVMNDIYGLGGSITAGCHGAATASAAKNVFKPAESSDVARDESIRSIRRLQIFSVEKATR